MSETKDTSNPKSSAPLRRKIVFRLIIAIYSVALVWLGIRVVFNLHYGRPIIGGETESDVWNKFYPELNESGVATADIRNDDGVFDVLLLGASVLQQTASLIDDELCSVFSDVRVFDVSSVAHTTRDSFHKSQRLANKKFDLILLYHGINDARMNCCQESMFKDDYTHCFWYKRFQKRLAGESISASELFTNLIPRETPKDEELEFGGNIKTATAFRTNMESIVRTAKANNIPVVMMTFAYRLPKDYTIDGFNDGKLGYGPPAFIKCPVELWGTAEHVPPTIDLHNEIIVDLANKYDNVIFVDQRKLVSANGENFGDVCHLTIQGRQLFVKNLCDAVAEHFSSTEHFKTGS